MTPTLQSLVATFSQESDTEQSDSLGQDIRIELTGHPDTDGYLIISTERWAVDTLDELVALLNRVLTMGRT